MITYQREDWEATYAEAEPLLRRHYAEIAHYQDIPLNPDLEYYRSIAPFLRVFSAREDDHLVGYATYVVKKNQHYQDSLQAWQDILFVAPEHRNARVGYHLIRTSDRALQEEGVQVVYQHVKDKHNFGALLERQGYTLVDHIYGKRLDKE